MNLELLGICVFQYFKNVTNNLVQFVRSRWQRYATVAALYEIRSIRHQYYSVALIAESAPM